MYELNFVDYLDPQHELLRAADLIDWDQLHHQMSDHYSTLGRRGKPIRLMVGLHILKHRYDCSDERAVEELHENAYWQSFCGLPYFQRGKIVDPTRNSRVRQDWSNLHYPASLNMGRLLLVVQIGNLFNLYANAIRIFQHPKK